MARLVGSGERKEQYIEKVATLPNIFSNHSVEKEFAVSKKTYSIKAVFSL